MKSQNKRIRIRAKFEKFTFFVFQTKVFIQLNNLKIIVLKKIHIPSKIHENCAKTEWPIDFEMKNYECKLQLRFDFQFVLLFRNTVYFALCKRKWVSIDNNKINRLKIIFKRIYFWNYLIISRKMCHRLNWASYR